MYLQSQTLATKGRLISVLCARSGSHFYDYHGHIRHRLAIVGPLVLFTVKTLFNASVLLLYPSMHTHDTGSTNKEHLLCCFNG